MKRILSLAIVLLALATLAPTCGDAIGVPQALICIPPGTPVDVQPVTQGSALFGCWVVVTYYNGCACSEEYTAPAAIPPESLGGHVDGELVARECMTAAWRQVHGLTEEAASVQASCEFQGYYQPGPTQPQGWDI